MPKVKLHQLAQSGATDGQTPRWSDAAGEYVPGDVSGGGGSSLGWFNVTDPAYGAAGDGTTDDTAAINAAIAAVNANGRGVLYFPTGTYLVTAGLTAITVPTSIRGDGCADPYFRGAATTINCNSTTASLFTLSGGAHGSSFSQLALVNTAGSAPTAGTAVLVQAGDGNRYVDVSIMGFYIDMDVQDGTEWFLDRCYFYGPVLYGLKIRHIDLPDGGDMGIFNSQFVAQSYNATAAIHVETGGGPRIVGNKINMRTSANHFTYGIDLSITASTGVLTIAANSIENCLTTAIRGRLAGGTFSNVAITGNEIAYWTSGATAGIDIDGFTNVSVVGNVGLSSPASAGAFVQLTSVVGGTVGLNTEDGFASEFSLTTCTGIQTITPADAITGLVDGSGISTADNGDGTWTVAATAAPTSYREIVMETGVSPPTPIINSAGTDWVYGEPK